MSETYIIDEYNGFDLRRGKGEETYIYAESQLRKIIGLLTQARETMYRPCVYEATLLLENPLQLDEVIQPSSFDPKSIKVALPASKYLYHWSIEYSKEKCLHVHIMIIFDQRSFNPLNHWRYVREQLSYLEGVISASIKPRYNGLGKYHAIKDEAEYLDAINRFCYQAKINQKAHVEGRSFGSSNIQEQYKYVQREFEYT